MKKFLLVWVVTVVMTAGVLAGSAPAVAADALRVLNYKRRQVGLYPLRYDPQLFALAERKNQTRARRGRHGHLGGSIGGRFEGVGWDSRRDPRGLRYNTCYWNTRKARYAGASVVVGRGGTYYELNLK